jgi:hypothetical protein
MAYTPIPDSGRGFPAYVPIGNKPENTPATAPVNQNTGFLDNVKNFFTGSVADKTTPAQADPLQSTRGFGAYIPIGQPAPAKSVPYSSPAKVLSTMPATMGALANLQSDPLSLKQSPIKPGTDTTARVPEAAHDLAVKSATLLSSRSPSEAIGNTGKVIGASASYLFSPVSALFEGLSKVPVVGTVPKLFPGLPITALSEASGNASDKFVDALPLSPETKNNVRGGVRDIFSLAGILAGGKALELAEPKIAEISKKYSAKDTTTIIDKAREMAGINTPIISKPTEVPKPIELPKAESAPTPVVPKASSVIEKQSALPIVEKPAPATKYLSHYDDEIDSLMQGKVKLRVNDGGVRTEYKQMLSPDNYMRVFRKDSKYKTTDEFASDLGMTENELMAEMEKRIHASTHDRANVLELNRLMRGDFTPEEQTQANEKSIDTDEVNAHLAGMQSPMTDTLPNTGSSLREISGTGETKVRGLSKGIDAKAVERKLTATFGDLPEYQTVSMKDQASKAIDLLSRDSGQAKRIAMGTEQAPEGIIPEMLLKVVEDKATKEGDVATLRELATRSRLTSEATTMGQRIRTLGERDPESPINAIREVSDARKAAQKKRMGVEDVKKVKGQIKDQIAKTRPTKQTWVDFVKSIQC